MLASDAHLQHHYLLPADECRYLLPYRPGSRDPASALLRAYKCPPRLARCHAAWASHKQAAIEQFASALRASLPQDWVECATWVPIPGSVRRDSPDYDDRLEHTLRLAFRRLDADVRPLLYQAHSSPADHRARRRASLAVLQQRLRIDAGALQGVRSRVVLFDDLLTSGKHYRASAARLLAALPGVLVSGCFLARRLLPGVELGCAAYGK